MHLSHISFFLIYIFHVQYLLSKNLSHVTKKQNKNPGIIFNQTAIGIQDMQIMMQLLPSGRYQEAHLRPTIVVGLTPSNPPWSNLMCHHSHICGKTCWERITSVIGSQKSQPIYS